MVASGHEEDVGDGTFAPPDVVAGGISSTPLAADLNGDVAADLAVLERGGDVLVRLAWPDAPGTFQAPVVVNPGSPARELAVIDSAGGPLLAALDVRSPAVSFYPCRADGTFTHAAGPAVPGALPAGLAAGDLDGDGRDDLVVVAGGSAEAFVYLRGAAGFAPAPDYRIGVGLIPSDVALADLNADGRLDVVVANTGANNVLIFPGEEGGFGPARQFATGTSPVGVTVQDLNGDGTPDLAVANEGSNDVTLLLGQGQGEAWSLAPGPRLDAGAGPVSTTAADLTGDGVLDLLVSNRQSNRVAAQ